MKVDFHTHTSASDGTDNTKVLIEKAIQAKIKCIAITDHDTVRGISSDFINENRIKIIPGVELSAAYKPGIMHIIGLNIDINNKKLQLNFNFLKENRDRRFWAILEKIQNLGININKEDVQKVAEGSSSYSRNHFATVLINKGYAKSRKEAFEKYLVSGSPAYVSKVKLSPNDCIQLILNAGGIPVLAHPNQLKLEEDELFSKVKELKSMGLQGIETYIPFVDESKLENYRSIALKLELLNSGGSDYHGSVKENIKLGIEFDASKILERMNLF